MTSEEARLEAARAWIQKADEALRAARKDLDVSPASTINRAYYACFYAASAILITEGRHFVKHAGVRSALHKHLIRPGRFPTELGDAYDNLMKTRQKADYEVGTAWSVEQAQEAIDVADRIVTAIRILLPY